MTIETFNKLIDGGYVTSVGFIEHYKNNIDELKKKSIVDLANKGIICKQIDGVDWEDEIDDVIDDVIVDLSNKSEHNEPVVAMNDASEINPVEVQPDIENDVTSDESEEIEVESIEEVNEE